MGPKYDLRRVVGAATDGELLLVGSRAKEIVLNYLEGLLEADAFARSLVASLGVEHFQETVTLEAPYAGEFDVYVCSLSPTLVTRHHLAHVATWYVKLKLIDRADGDSVLVISMHPAERPPMNDRRQR